MIASVIGVIAGVGVAIGLKALLNAVGFGIPGNGVVVKPSGMITAFLAGNRGHAHLVDRPGPPSGPHPADRRHAQRRARAPDQPGRSQRDRHRHHRARGRCSCSSGCSAAAASARSGSARCSSCSACSCSARCSRGLALAIGAPLTKIKGITGSLARENAARNPRRTATTGAAVMIAVSLVGFITIFAASANASISSAIDQQLKTDYIITSGGGNGPPTGLSPALDQKIAALPEIQASAPVRLGEVGINKSRTFVNAVNGAEAAQVVDLDGVTGSLAAIDNNGIAVSKRKADDNHWKIGTIIPVTFVKTGKVPLKVVYIYKANTFGDYFISLKTYEKNFTDQLDFLILAKLKPGVSAEQGRKAIEPLVKPYPTAKLKDNAQYKADQKKQVNQVLERSSTCCCSSR